MVTKALCLKCSNSLTKIYGASRDTRTRSRDINGHIFQFSTILFWIGYFVIKNTSLDLVRNAWKVLWNFLKWKYIISYFSQQLISLLPQTFPTIYLIKDISL